MAGLSDVLDPTKLGPMLQDPRMMLGLALLSRGNPNSVAGQVGAAGLGVGQMLQQQQQQQALQQYRQAAIEQQQRQAQQQQQRYEQEQQQRQQMQSPEFLAQLGPLARQMAALGVSPQELISANNADAMQGYRDQQLALQQQQQDRLSAQAAHGAGGQGGRAPTPRQILEEPLPDGRVQKHIYDASTGSYKPYGSPYSPYSPRAGKSSAAAPGATEKADSMVNSILGLPTDAQGGETQAVDVPLAQAGTGGLSSYLPKTGAALLTSGGAMPKGASNTPANDPSLAAAANAIAKGANPAAVRQRLLAAGYTESALRQAGL